LTAFTDQTLDYAERVERDKAMRNDCLRALLNQKRLRAAEWYDMSGVSNTLTGMDHVSMNWTLPEEENKFLELKGEAIDVGVNLDTTITHSWTDLRMLSTWYQYKDKFPKIPKFRVRIDVEGESCNRPVRTGVYVPQDDSFGTLQFAWTGNSGGVLEASETFSDLAREYIDIVGRDRVWKAPTEAASVPGRVEPTDKYFDDWCGRHKQMSFRESISSRNARAGDFEDDTSTLAHRVDNIRCLQAGSFKY
jgi:hypothetical protein